MNDFLLMKDSSEGDKGSHVGLRVVVDLARSV